MGVEGLGAAGSGDLNPSGCAGHQFFIPNSSFPARTPRGLPRILDQERRRGGMCGGDRGGCWLLGVCAVALGAGIFIAAIFPVGALMFLVAGLLIACGCACCRR